MAGAMKRGGSLLAGLLSVSALAACAQHLDAGVDLPPDHPAIVNAEARAALPTVTASKIILIGDSTTSVKGGWGPSFCGQHVKSDIVCVNLARGGRSTFSFRAEGSWDIALGEMAVPGYEDTFVLIQFGHNDQPGKPQRSTDLETEFKPNLERYVAEVRETGAIPVLLTPLTRRMFTDGVLAHSLDPWAEAVFEVGRKTGTPVIDLYGLSAAQVKAMGPVDSIRLSENLPSQEILQGAATGTSVPSENAQAPEGQSTALEPPFENLAVNAWRFDYTHIGREGADVFSNIVAVELARAFPELQPSLYADPTAVIAVGEIE